MGCIIGVSTSRKPRASRKARSSRMSRLFMKRVSRACRRAPAGPATVTGPPALRASSDASWCRRGSAPPQWVTGKRWPKGSTPLRRSASSFSSRRRTSGLAPPGRSSGGGAPGGGAEGGGGALMSRRSRLAEGRLDEGVDPAAHDRFDVAHLHARAVILADLVGVEGVRADRAAEGDLLLLSAQLRQLLALLLLVDLVEA